MVVSKVRMTGKYMWLSSSARNIEPRKEFTLTCSHVSVDVQVELGYGFPRCRSSIHFKEQIPTRRGICHLETPSNFEKTVAWEQPQNGFVYRVEGPTNSKAKHPVGDNDCRVHEFEPWVHSLGYITKVQKGVLLGMGSF